MSGQAQRRPALASRLDAFPDHSWRADPAVPAFPDERPLIVFDGVCVLCSGFARFVARRDRAQVFRLTAAQSPLGQALFRHFGLDAVEFETNLLIADGRATGKLDAFAGIMTRLGGVCRIAALAHVVPSAPGDCLYDLVARNRYRLFGRTEACIVPDADWRQRVIG